MFYPACKGGACIFARFFVVYHNFFRIPIGFRDLSVVIGRLYEAKIDILFSLFFYFSNTQCQDTATSYQASAGCLHNPQILHRLPQKHCKEELLALNETEYHPQQELNQFLVALAQMQRLLGSANETPYSQLSGEKQYA